MYLPPMRFLCTVFVVVLVGAAGIAAYSSSLKSKQELTSKATQVPSKRNSHSQASLVSVKKFGLLALGGDHPLGYRSLTFYPEKNIPKSRFYVAVVEKDLWCALEGCSLEGAHARMMGGWLQGENAENSQIADEIGLNKYPDISSLVIVANGENKIVGLYPNNGLDDVNSILRLHPGLADFNLLKGVSEFGLLKVGSKSPVMPGDPTGYSPEHPSSYPYTHIPKNKKFYILSVNKKLLNRGYCAFYECETLAEYPNGTYIEELGGWFSSNETPEVIQAFGLDPDRVSEGKQSLIVVADPSGIIVSIHPGRNITHILSILSSHKDLVDVEAFYERE